MSPKPIRKADADVLAIVRTMSCCICGRRPVDASHVKTRGSGGPDTTWNVVPHCRQHHQEWGQLGARRFFLRYTVALIYLRGLGWEWDGEKLWHPSLTQT